MKQFFATVIETTLILGLIGAIGYGAIRILSIALGYG